MFARSAVCWKIIHSAIAGAKKPRGVSLQALMNILKTESISVSSWVALNAMVSVMFHARRAAEASEPPLLSDWP